MKTYTNFATVLIQLLANDTAIRLTVNGYMPLSVNYIGKSAEANRLVSICHYGEQNGWPDAEPLSDLIGATQRIDLVVGL